MKTRKAKYFPPSAERSELLAYIRQLEAELIEMDEEHDALDRELAQIRSCTDANCRLCKSCVTKAFITIKPAPLTLPKKYAEAPWRQ